MKTSIKENYVRAPKTGKAKDDYKVLLVGSIFVVFLLIGQFAAGYLSEQRWFRDVSRQTPFYDVSVTNISLSEDNRSVTISGYMTKRRCEFQSLTGYIITTNGKRHRVYVNTTPEDILTGLQHGANRPPSELSERWGPWQISFSFKGLNPDSWEVWAHHKCPNFATVQSNLFASGPWITQIVEPTE